MGRILDDYFEYAKLYKDFMPKEVNELLDPEKVEREELKQPGLLEEQYFIIQGYEELSTAMYSFIKLDREYPILNIELMGIMDRFSYGFDNAEQMIECAKRIIRSYDNDKYTRIQYLEKLKIHSSFKNDDEMMKDIILEQELLREIRHISSNMSLRDRDDIKRLLLKKLESKRTLAYYILSRYNVCQALDDILVALEAICDIDNADI